MTIVFDEDKMKRSPRAPRVIREIGFDFDWSEEKVWALNIPVEEINMEELDWHFDIPFWDYNGVPYSLKPNEVFENTRKYKEEYERIMRSELKYPLDIMLWRGRWLLLDGLHRLAKAKLHGQSRVRVRKIPVSDIPLIKI